LTERATLSHLRIKLIASQRRDDVFLRMTPASIGFHATAFPAG
jgi:hypothetical protein